MGGNVPRGRARASSLPIRHGVQLSRLASLAGSTAIFDTPSNHRVHPSSLPEHLDKKNDGRVLVVWDRIFGIRARYRQGRLRSDHSNQLDDPDRRPRPRSPRATARPEVTCDGAPAFGSVGARARVRAAVVETDGIDPTWPTARSRLAFTASPASHTSRFPRSRGVVCRPPTGTLGFFDEEAALRQTVRGSCPSSLLPTPRPERAPRQKPASFGIRHPRGALDP